MNDFNMNLQLFGAGTLVNASTSLVNADTGATTPYTGQGMSPGMKTFYDTDLLENARNEMYFEQFGKKLPLPANNGSTIELRQFDTLPDAGALQEGVIPTGEKFGQKTLTGSMTQFGMFVAITDKVQYHHVDNVLLGASEELGASAAETHDKFFRNGLMEGTNVMYCDTVGADGKRTPVTGYAGMSEDNNRLTPDMVNKAATALKKAKAKRINGKFVAIIHPSVTYDIRSSEEWIEVHKYAATTEIFNGEIGELHGVRFVESNNAPVHEEDGKLVYSSFFLGKDAYGIIDPAAGGMEMIVKSKEEIGGPLEQYSTVGYKFEQGVMILYPESVLRVESCSAYSDSDSPNYNTEND